MGAKRNSNDSSTTREISDDLESLEISVGPFREFRADNIPGHNTSVIYALDAVEDIDGANVMALKEGYREGPGVVITLTGASGIEYQIKVKYNPKLLEQLNKIIPKLIRNEGDLTKILTDFAHLIVGWRVYAYDPEGKSWDSICIDAIELVDPDSGEKTMPHVMDQVATLVRALSSDIDLVRVDPKMYTLRRYILRNWPSIWLLNEVHETIPHDEFREILAGIEKTERGKEQ